MTEDFLKQMQSFVAESATGPSAIRNQGASGLIASSNEFFKKIELKLIPSDAKTYAEWLNGTTEALRAMWEARLTDEEKAKINLQSPFFGVARKATNLFLRSAAYNRYLNEAYDLDRHLPLMEVPVDSSVAGCLREHTKQEKKLPDWPGLKRLTRDQHTEYQEAGTTWAAELGVHRVDLDAYCYRVKPQTTMNLGELSGEVMV